MIKYILTSILFLAACAPQETLVEQDTSRLDLLEARISALETKDALFQAQLDALSGRTDDLELFQVLQNRQNAFVQNELTRLENLIDQSSQDILGLTTQYNTLSQTVTNMSTTINSQLAGLQSQIDTIQLTPGKSAYETWLDLGNTGSPQDFIDSLRGAQGPKGDQGLQGLMGPQGVAGQDGSSVVAVKLCPGDFSTYPEQGLRIGTSLYAVYYGNFGGTMQAFMAKLVPGSYITTNGANCRFTVDANGQTY